MYSTLSFLLVLTGLLIQVAALVPLRKLVAMLPQGTLRNRWLLLRGLIGFFIIGYFSYMFLACCQQTQLGELLFPAILLLGAVFVWLTTGLSLQTAADLKRIDLLEAENVTDPLTNVFNRRYLERRLNEEVSRAKRHALPLSVMMIDIDYFKRINDTYGHQAGDVTLITMCRLINEDLRDLDMLARYGGEEFVVVCVNTPLAGASLVAERLRHLIEAYSIEVTDGAGVEQTLQVTISVGVASFSEQHDSMEKLIQAADGALYRAKYEGRNRVITAEEVEVSFAFAPSKQSKLV